MASPLARIPNNVPRPVTAYTLVDRIKANAALKNWWTMVQAAAYTDPASGFTNILPRAGTVELKGTGVVPFIGEGGWQVANFPNTGQTESANQINVRFQTGKLAGPWSVMTVHRTRTANTENWSVETKAGGNYIRSSPSRTQGTSQVSGIDLVLGATKNASLGPAADLNTRVQRFSAIDFTTGLMKGAFGMNAPVSATPSDWSLLLAAMEATFTWHIGEYRPQDGYDGTIAEFALIQGDIFDAGLATLRAELVEYNATAYVGA